MHDGDLRALVVDNGRYRYANKRRHRKEEEKNRQNGKKSGLENFERSCFRMFIVVYEVALL